MPFTSTALPASMAAVPSVAVAAELSIVMSAVAALASSLPTVPVTPVIVMLPAVAVTSLVASILAREANTEPVSVTSPVDAVMSFPKVLPVSVTDAAAIVPEKTELAETISPVRATVSDTATYVAFSETAPTVPSTVTLYVELPVTTTALTASISPVTSAAVAAELSIVISAPACRLPTVPVTDVIRMLPAVAVTSLSDAILALEVKMEPVSVTSPVVAVTSFSNVLPASVMDAAEISP